MCSIPRSGVGPTTTDTSLPRIRTGRWITTSGEHFGAGRGADTPVNRLGGFGGSTSGSRVTDTGCLRLKPEGTPVNRSCCRCFQPLALGLSGTSESDRTLTHSIQLGTPTSLTDRVCGCWSSCTDAASQHDSGSSNVANARDALNPSSKMIAGWFIPLSLSSQADLALSPT